jgi:long-chain acyl-CoA synthetase
VQVEDFLERSAAQTPHKNALIFGSRRWTYRDIEQQANRVAHALIGKGVGRGHRVAVHLENSPQTVIAIFGILKAGAVFVVIHPTTKIEKLTHILGDCGAAALITNAPRASRVARNWQQLQELKTILLAESDPAFCNTESGWDEHPPLRQGIDIDLAALVYTSGSTGRPKGVMLTHLNIVSAMTSIAAYLKSGPSDVIFSALPLSFTYGLCQLFTTFLTGGTLVLERGFTYPRQALEILARENVTGLPLVPTMAALLLQMDLSRFALPALRYITNAGAALPVQQIARLRAFFPHVAIYSMYGQTECMRISYLSPEQIDVRPKSVGRGMPNEEVFIADAEGGRAAPGVAGELVVRGSNVMQGYWGLPHETARVLKPGPMPGERVLYTGDLFQMDEEGYLYFVGRKDDIIKTRGEKVSPREVEEVLHSLEDVAEAVVIGVPDALLGQAVKAIVTPRTGADLTDQQVLAHCSRFLEDFAIPKIVEVRDALPRTANGKIDKLELTAAAGTRHE